MIVTPADVAKAETAARMQRLDNCRALLRIDETKASSDDLKLVEQVKAALAGDGSKLDLALRGPNVNALFRRGVLFFERSHAA